jgi:hypothetical protein
MFKNPMPRPAMVKKPKDEKEMVGQFKSFVSSVGAKAPVLSRLVGKM